MAATDKQLWSEKYRQAGVMLATFWGVLAAIVLVLALYAYQRDAALSADPAVHTVAPKGVGHVWLDVPPLEAAPLPQSLSQNPLQNPPQNPSQTLLPQADPASVEAPAAAPAIEEEVPSAPPDQPAKTLPPPAAPVVTPVEPPASAPAPQPDVVEAAEAPPEETTVEPAPTASSSVAPVAEEAAPADLTPADPAPADSAPLDPAPAADFKDIFVVLTGGGENFAVLDVMPAGTAMVLGVIDDTTARFVAKAQARNIQILLPLPVAQSGPLPSLAAEPDENRKRFATFLNQLPPVDGLYIPAGHPFNKDMASFAALMEEAKARGLRVIGTLPANLQTPTTPVPVHHVVDGELLAGDAGNLAGVLQVLVGTRAEVTVLTAPADLAFARALGAFAKDSRAYRFTAPDGF